MATSRYENIWQLLSTYDFKLQIPNKFHCSLCKNVTIEPFGSLCGCRFCSGCIIHYLKDGKKHCPGGKGQCIDEILEINVNVTKDLACVRRITQLIVKCPNEICEEKCDLESMSDHLRICDMSTSKCLYETMGCQGSQLSSNNLKTHYNNEWLTHSQLMVDAFDNLRNEFNELRVKVERSDEEITKLNKDCERKELMIMEMNQQISDQRKEIKDQRIEINTLKDNYERREASMILLREVSEIKQQIDILRRDIDILQVKDERRISEMEVENKMLIDKLENIKKEMVVMDVRKDIQKHNKSLNYLKINQENVEKDLNSVIMKVRDSRIFDEREFIWRVDKFSKMREDRRWRDLILWRYSLKFYLSLVCKGDHLGYCCLIMKGEFDNDFLEWPMKHKILLSLINQDTMKVHKCMQFNYDSYHEKNAFGKPKDKWNYFIGDNSFILIKDLMNTPGLLLNDSLVVSFIIDYQ